MRKRSAWNRIAQLAVVLAFAYGLKLYYSTASADRLRWILAPTAACVELVSGESFEFESHAGYISGDRSFLIAPSCAGVNFLITAFLMLSAKRLISDRTKDVPWRFFPVSALAAYLVTLTANTTRIVIAMPLEHMTPVSGWLNSGQVHRIEGILIYFGFLMLLFVVSENTGAAQGSRSLRTILFPLLVYYAIAFGVPFANGAYRQGPEFEEHSLFVLLVPLALVLPVVAFRCGPLLFRQSRRIVGGSAARIGIKSNARV